MFKDASLPPNAPMIDGPNAQPKIDGEEDASHDADADADADAAAAAPAISTSTNDLEAVCEDLHGRVVAFLNKPADSDLVRRVQEQTRISMGVIEKALNDYDFSSLSLSYNGGKDCLVLLILYLATLYAHVRQSSKPTTTTGTGACKSIGTTAASATLTTKFPISIPAIYAQSPDPFPAISDFVATSSRRYHLDLYTVRTDPRPGHGHGQGQHQHQHQHQEQHHNSPATSTPPSQNEPTPRKRITIRDAFATYLSSQENHPDPNHIHPSPSHNRHHPKIKAIFVGTRRTDPHGANLTHFDRTDHGWPDFMRIHPVIDWRLSDIWCFLRADELREPDGSPLAYCQMYDQGYTSLGGVGDTLRNPRLRYVDGDGRDRYRPAYELTEDEEERLGRE